VRHDYADQFLIMQQLFEWYRKRLHSDVIPIAVPGVEIIKPEQTKQQKMVF
jgi:hypothetical protein